MNRREFIAAMNPNLEFGQAIRGVSNGRGTGLIDVNSFIYAVQGIALLQAAHGLDLDLIRSCATGLLNS